jgi:ABC-2 type transport system ATP-binding protein
LAEALAESGVAVEDLGLTQPTLDDVFLTLTGHAPEEEGGEATGSLPASAGAGAAARETEETEPEPQEARR